MLDGKWKNFEIKEIKLKVKSLLGIKLNVKREVIWSVFGPVIKNKRGHFAFFSHDLDAATQESDRTGWYSDRSTI